MRQFLIAAALCAAAVAWLAWSAPEWLEAARKPSRPTVASLERNVAGLERQVATMEQTADRYAKWRTCVSWVPVNEVGDPDNRWGYNYDERDGTGRTYSPALAVDWKDQTPEYVFLRFSRREGCESQPVQPGGTGEDASVETLDAIRTELAAFEPSREARAPSPYEAKIRELERRVARLGQRAAALERTSARFDEWESCLSWVPVTEFGDADNRFGYLFGDEGAEPGYRPAITIDRSEWDDPDYEFLAFAGRDRPFTDRECEGEPGEGVD